MYMVIKDCKSTTFNSYINPRRLLFHKTVCIGHNILKPRTEKIQADERCAQPSVLTSSPDMHFLGEEEEA